MKMRFFNIMLFAGLFVSVVCCTSDDGVSGVADNTSITALESAYKALCTPSDQSINVMSDSSAKVVSKGSLPSTPEGYFQTDSIGVFMLAVKRNTVLGDATDVPIHWSNGAKLKNYTGKTADDNYADYWYYFYKTGVDVWSVFYDINNVSTKAEYVYDEASNITGTKLIWKDNRDRYYPMGKYHTYGFYAYSPRTTNIIYSDASVTARIPLNGTQDVFFGQSDSTTYEQGQLSSDRYKVLRGMAYSAEFYRQEENREGGQPMATPMQFYHKLFKLQFKIVPGKETASWGWDDYAYARETHVDSIAITDTPSHIDLCVANKSALQNSGTITFPYGRTSVYYLKDSINGKADQEWQGAYPLTDESGQPVALKVGEGIMLPLLTAAQEEAQPYRLEMVVTAPIYDENGNKTGKYRKERIIYPMSFSVSNFKPGTTHTLILTVYRPEKMGQFTATLENWDDKTGTDDIDLPVY